MYRDTIISYRKQFDKPVEDQLRALNSIEINPVELCTRNCVFCPRAHGYKNQSLHISNSTAHSIGNKLAAVEYKGGIGVSGFGEPLLHTSISDIVRVIRSYLPDLSRFDIITNGDMLTADKAVQLIDAGITNILVNLYDGPQQIKQFEDLFAKAQTDKYMLRHHYYGPGEDYGLNINNRAGAVKDREVQTPLKKSCYLPFYKFIIDWNGDILLCPQDWNRKSDLNLNINTHTVSEIWFSEKIAKYRRLLIDKDRSTSPCKTCDCSGTLCGEESYKKFVEIS